MPPPRLLLAVLLSLAAATLVACGSSTKGLIPASAAGPLQSDFETVQQAAENGEGNCATTEAALLKTSEDLAALPTTVDAGLRNNLHQGVANLRAKALALCAQPLPQTTATTETPKPTTTATTPTTTTPTTTSTTPTTPTSSTTTPTTPSPGGGTPAPGETPGGGTGNEQGKSESPGAGRAGGAGPGEGQEGGGK
ncbi:MAG TPA: hypothetical protein VNR42_05755 [Solirubrobacteraceae bacterium]|nr:hypothetical protein [Solirubrobacteraceae bacterium]